MLAKLSVKKPFTVLVAVILVIILGVVAFTRMTPDLLPNIDLPYVIVATSYVGASPEEVESTITKPVEQGMATLDDIKSIQSVSGENYSMVMMEFAADANMDATTMNVREKLDLIGADWNNYVGTPVILKLNPNMLPLAAVAFAYDNMDNVALSGFYTNTVQPRLEGIEGVASISASGLITEKVNVVLRQDRMDALNEKIRAGVDVEFQDGEEKIADSQSEIDDGNEELEKAEKKLRSGKSSLSSAKKELTTQIDAARSDLDGKESQLNSAKAQLAAAKSGIQQLEEGIAACDDAVSGAQSAVSGAQQAKDAAQAQLDTANAMDDADPDKAAAVATAQSALQQAEQGLAAAQAAFSATQTASAQQKAALQAQLTAAWSALSAQGISDMASLNSQISQMQTGLDQIADGRIVIDEQEQAGKQQISSASSKLKSGEKQLTESKDQLTDAQEQLDDAKEELDDAKDKAYDATDLNHLLSLETVGAILGAENFSMPAGYAAADDSGTEWLVYVGDKLQSADELKDLILFDLDLEGVDPIRLSDVADIFVSDNSATTYARINGQNGVLLTFNKQSGYATANVSESMHQTFEKMESEYPGLQFSTLMDQGQYIQVVIGSVLENIVLGAILAIIILLLFLRDIRPTFIVACSIPISVTFAIVLMYFSGVTMNIISMAGLATGVGMLVDNSIVVIENIYRLRRNGASAVKAAVSGTVQMAGAITASTLTTVCVFLPIVFVEGITKQLFTDMALTIAYSLLASLVVALTLVPAMGAGVLRKTREQGEKKEAAVLRGYRKILEFSLNNKALAILISLLLLIVSAYAAVGKGFTYLPDMDSPQMTVEITLDEDATFDEAVAMTDEIAARVQTIPEVETVGSMFSTGLTSMFGMGGGSDGYNQTMLYVVLREQKAFLGYVPKSQRQRSSVELSTVIEQLCADLDCQVAASGSGNMAEYMDALGGSGITIHVFGNDLEKLQAAAKTVAAKLAGVTGTANVSDGIDKTTPALRVVVDKEKAMLKGLTVAQVYQNLALALTEDATATTIEDTDSDIVIRMPESNPTVTDIRERVLTFQKQDGTYQKVALKDIASFSESETLQSISRQAQRRYLTVSAEVAKGANVTLVTADAQKALEGCSLPDGVTMEFAGENETIVSALKDLLLMLLLGIVIVYLIMVAQFQSLMSPFIVMFTIPLAFTGGLIALLLCGMEISIVAMIGFVMLVGIIVNNGIVLIDSMNRLRAEGMERREAIYTAATTRLRPVLMTALTTILGLVPLSLGLGIGGGLIQPVAVVSIGGLTYATFMTLFVVPILYDGLIKKPPRTIQNEDLEVLTEEEEARQRSGQSSLKD